MSRPAILKTTVQPGQRARELLHSVNDASQSAQAGWTVLLALTAYYIVALGGVNDRDLLINAPIALPLLGISLSLHRFFFFAPLIYIFIHFGVLVHHAVLAHKTYALAAMLEGQEILETAVSGKPAVSPLRYEISTVFFTQFLAGPPQSRLLRFFQQFMVWCTLLLLPLVVLLAFQIGFLPFHDTMTTWLHRTYVAIDIAMLALAGVFLASPERRFWRALGTGILRYPLFYAVTAIGFAAFLFLAYGAATIPGEWLDQALATPRFSVEVPQLEADKPPRLVFAPAAVLFEGPLDRAAGRARSPFHRNLIAIDDDFSPREAPPGRPALSLRYRDLRYARLDRTDLRQADLTCADLTGAVLAGAKLDGAKTGCPIE